MGLVASAFPIEPSHQVRFYFLLSFRCFYWFEIIVLLFLFYLFVLAFQDTVCLCSHGCPGTASASWMLRLKVCTTAASLGHVWRHSKFWGALTFSRNATTTGQCFIILPNEETERRGLKLKVRNWSRKEVCESQSHSKRSLPGEEARGHRPWLRLQSS